MTPVARIKKLIVDNIDRFPDLKAEHVHGYMIPPGDKTETDAIIVISELPGRGHGYGNDVVVDEKRRVQITFYYPKDFNGDEEGLEEKIESFLVTKGYYCYANAGHVMAPDNQNITNTLKFNYVKEIN